MTTDQAIETLSEAMNALAKDGYVCTGELSFFRPQVPGMVTVNADFIRESKLTTMRAKAVPVDPILARVSATVYSTATTPVVLLNEACIRCGGTRMQQAGACKVCLDCGESGGCG